MSGFTVLDVQCPGITAGGVLSAACPFHLAPSCGEVVPGRVQRGREARVS